MASRTKSIRKFSDESLVWGGWLYHNPKKRSEKTEKKSEKRRFNKSHRYWCELHREVTNYPRELRFYAKQRNGFQHKDEKVVDTVPLKSDVIKVMPGVEYGIPESFKIVTSKAIYIFGTSTPEEAQSWAYAVWKELYGPVVPGVVYNFNVEVEQNRTTQKYNVRGSYLLKVYDTEIKLFTANGKILTQFKAYIKDIVKATSPPVLLLSLAVLNISTSDVGGDVMVFFADSARDIVRIINHRRQLLLDRDFSQRPSTVKLGNVPPSSIHAKSQSHPRYVSNHVSNPRSKTNPITTGGAFSVVDKPLMSPKRKNSEPFGMVYGIHQERLISPPISETAPSQNRLTMRPPAPLPRSPASLHNVFAPPTPQSCSSRDSISSSNSDSSGGYVIDSLPRNSYYLKLYSSMHMDTLDIIYRDTQLGINNVYSRPRSRSYQENSDGESNYSDSELWLSTEQKRLSRKSKRISRTSSQRRSTVSCCGYHRSISERALSFGNNVDKPLVPINKVSARKVKSHDVKPSTPADVYRLSQSYSDSKLDEPECGPVDEVDGVTKEASEVSNNGSNCSDGELWLSLEQKKFSRRSKRISQKGQMKKAKSVAANPTKPEIKPKPKNRLVASRIKSVEKNFSHDDQRLQSESVTPPLRMRSDGDDGNSYSVENSTMVTVHGYCVINSVRRLPLPQLPPVSLHTVKSQTIVPHCKLCREPPSLLTVSGDHYDYVDDQSNQSDSEILLSEVQRDFSRRSRKLSSRKRNSLRNQSSNSSDKVKTKLINGKTAAPGRFKPQVAPRTAPKPVVPVRRKVSSSSGSKQETSPRQNLSPTSLHNNSNHFWANTNVDQIASDIASSFSPTHVYSKVTSNGALPSLPIAIQNSSRTHLNLLQQYSGSLDDSYSPDNAYSYPYADDWMNSVEQCHGSDSDLWFGDGLKRLSKKSKRTSGSRKRLQSEEGFSCTSKSQQCVGCNDDETAVKVKPRTSPRSFKPEVAPRKFCTPPPAIQDVSPTKSCDQQQKPSDELPTTPISISHLNWSADEDKTYLVNNAIAICNPGNTNSEEETSGSGYVINTLEDSVYLELEGSNHIYSQPIFAMDSLDCKIKNKDSEVHYTNTQEMVK